MNMSPKRGDRIGFHPGTEKVVIWLVVVVVVPSLLLSLFSFWAMRQQEQLTQQAAQHRIAVLLSEAEEQMQARLAELNNEVSSVPTPFRLGAYYELARLKQRLGQWEDAVKTVVEGMEWMAQVSDPDDYQTCAYYLQRMRSLWSTIPSEAISDSVRKHWKDMQEQWEERSAAYQLHSVLKETILPTLWPSVAALPAGEAQYMQIQTPQGWQVSLVIRLADGRYFGGIVSLADIRDALLPPLNVRLRRLGEGAEGRIMASADPRPESALAVLRLAQPLSFWQLAAAHSGEASPVARWQAHLIRWSVILCLGAILAGVYWTWRRIQRERELSAIYHINAVDTSQRARNSSSIPVPSFTPTKCRCRTPPSRTKVTPQ